MNKTYYLFSPSKKTEALYYCLDNNFIDKPYIKSDVYPIGIILSKTMRTIIPVIEQDSIVWSPDELLKGVVNFSETDSSFSSICCNDENLKIIFNSILGENRELYENVDSKKFFSTLIRMNDYLSHCSYDKNLCSITNFNKQLSIIGERIPSYLIYEDSTTKRKKIFSPRTVDRTIPLFKHNKINQPPEQYGKLELPLYVYEINFISDLLIASLQQIFAINYTITKCRFCNNYFVSNNKRNKYCPKGLSDKEACYDVANRIRVKSLNDDEIQRTYNSVRNMLMRNRNRDIEHYGENYKRYEDFKQKRKEYIRNIKLGKATTDEYHKWLKSFYVYKK